MPLILRRLPVVLVDPCFTLRPNTVPQFEFLESCFCLCAAVVFLGDYLRYAARLLGEYLDEDLAKDFYSLIG